MVNQDGAAKICTLEQIQILSDALGSLSLEEIEELLKTFPFMDLISINIMNHELLRYHTIFLIKLTDTEQFFGKEKYIVQTLEFSLANLLSLERVDLSEDFLGLLLKLLRCITSQSKQRKKLCEIFQNERERILEVLTKTTKLKTFTADHVDDCFTVISDMLDIHGVLPLTTSRNLAEIAEIFKGLRNVRELSMLTNIAFKRFSISSEVFIVCACWLLLYGPMLLKETTDAQLLSQLLKTMTDFHTKYGYIRTTKRHQKSDVLNALETFYPTLAANSDVIVGLCTDPKLREDATRVLAVAMAEIDGGGNGKWDVVHRRLRGLPERVADWPGCRDEVFFEVCAFLCRYSSPYWDSADILRSASTLVYSLDRHALSPPHLRAVCLVYALLLPPPPSPSTAARLTVVLGDDLLVALWRRRHQLDELLTRHPAQLCWILRRGRAALRRRALRFWLSGGGGAREVVGRCVRWGGAGEDVRGLLMDRHLEEEDVVDGAIELIRSLEDPKLSTRIAMTLCFVFREEKLFRRLILAGPGVPEDRTTAMMLCESMSIQLIYITDEKVFGIACAFCKNLIVTLKTETDIIKTFCRDLRTVKYLLIRLPQLGEEAAIELLGLLRILVLVQKRNHTRFDDKLEVDLHLSLGGHPGKTAKCLDLLQLVVSKDMFLRLSPCALQDLFRKLLDVYTSRPELAVKSLLCMTELLKAHQWLSSTSTTMAFVEVNCSLEVDERSWQEFVVFLAIWIGVLGKRGTSARCAVDVGVVRNYLRRVPYLARKQRNKLWRMLDKLEEMKEKYPFC